MPAGDGAEATASGADRAHEHDRSRAAAPALMNVGAVGFLADSVQSMSAQGLFNRAVVLARRRSDLEPLGLGARCDRDSASLP
jgi:hypothetical protein